MCLIILLSLVCFVCYAIELPLDCTWYSQNGLRYNSSQTNKELNWDEFYQVDIAVDSLHYENVQLDLLLRNRADFLTNNIELNSLELSYHLPGITLFASTRDHGFGKSNKFNPHSLIEPRMQNYLYQDTRFNGIGFKVGRTSTYLSFIIGGNKQNQAISSVTGSWNNGNSLQLELTAEGRVTDSFLRSPVYLGSFSGEYVQDRLHIATTNSASYFPDHGNTTEHINTFSLISLSYQAGTNSLVCFEAEHQKPEFIRSPITNIQASFHHRFHKLALSPGLSYHMINKEEDYGYYLLTEFWVNQHQRFGILYRMEDTQSAKLIHYFGLQAELRYGV